MVKILMTGDFIRCKPRIKNEKLFVAKFTVTYFVMPSHDTNLTRTIHRNGAAWIYVWVLITWSLHGKQGLPLKNGIFWYVTPCGKKLETTPSGISSQRALVASYS
jgi:hypothetical protein